MCGVNDHNIQRRLLQEAELTYKTAYDLATAMEAAAKDAQDLRRPTPTVQVQQVQEQRPLRCHRCGGKTHLSNAC